MNERGDPFWGGQIVRISNGFPAPRQDKPPLGTPLGDREQTRDWGDLRAEEACFPFPPNAQVGVKTQKRKWQSADGGCGWPSPLLYPTCLHVLYSKGRVWPRGAQPGEGGPQIDQH